MSLLLAAWLLVACQDPADPSGDAAASADAGATTGDGGASGDTDSTGDAGLADGGEASGDTGAADGGAADGGAADTGGAGGDGGATDGGATDSGATDGSCSFGMDPWPVATPDDLWQAQDLAFPDMLVPFSLTVDMVFWLSSYASAAGVDIADLPCVTVEESDELTVVDAGDGCELDDSVLGEHLFMSGRLEQTMDDSGWLWSFDDFVYEGPSTFNLHERATFHLDGLLFYNNTDKGPAITSALSMACDGFSPDSGYPCTAYDVYQETEIWSVDGGEHWTAYVEVHEIGSDGPTGAFCLESDSAFVDTCDAGDREGYLRVEGDAVGELTLDGSTSCDGCYPFTLDGVEGEPDCW